MIVIPMLLIVLYAFTKQGNDVVSLQFTFDNFKKFFTDPDFLKTLWLSLRISLITTVLCAVSYTHLDVYKRQMHDLYDTSAQAAIILIPKLQEKGFQLVTVSELYTYHPDKVRRS